MARQGKASMQVTQLVLATYGTTCHLCGQPGATTRDHLIPYSHGGTDDLHNLRPAHRRCNSKRGNRALNGHGADIRVVMGPPAGGKSSYVLERARVGDIVVDLDALARALMPVQLDDRTHVYPQHVRHVAIGARAAAIDRATRLTGTGTTVWIIHADPGPDDLERYRFLRYQVIVVDPGRAVVEARVATERPSYMQAYVPKWYARHGAHTAASAHPEPALAAAAAGGGHSDW